MQTRHLAILSYITVCIVWGSTYLFIKIGVTDMPFLLFAGIRFTAAGLIMLAVSRFRRWPFPATFSDYKTHIFAGFMLLFISNGLICWAEQWIDSGLTSLLVASIPLFIGLIETLFPSEQRISPLSWAGLIVGFGGVAALVGPHFDFTQKEFLAMLAALAAALNWAMASVYLKRRTVSGAMLPGVGVQMLTAGLVFMVVAPIFGEFSLRQASWSGYGALLYLIFFGSILAYSAFNYMLKAMPATKAGTYAYVNPVVAVLLGVLVLQEEITGQNIIAAAIILLGVLLVQLSKTPPAEKAVSEPQ